MHNCMDGRQKYLRWAGGNQLRYVTLSGMPRGVSRRFELIGSNLRGFSPAIVVPESLSA